MNLRAAIFDFDGVIVETEAADYEGWRAVYRDHGADLAFEDWKVAIGTVGAFDPVAHLSRITGRAVDPEAARTRHRSVAAGIIGKSPVLPGVVDRLDEARSMGLKVAVASSSGEEWVNGHLSSRGLRERFDAVVVRGARLRTKPWPDVYLEALRVLGVRAGEAVAFEDSTPGIAAAKAAGIFTVAVPNGLTARLDLSQADLRVGSLTEVTFAQINGRLTAAGRT